MMRINTNTIKGWKVATKIKGCEHTVNCIELTVPFVHSIGARWNVNTNDLSFTIVGQWGEIVNGEKNIQTASLGDFICQNQTDPTDVWIVNRKIFINTYNINDRI